MTDNIKHISYIDQIKGFAIVLVVLAHMMAWTYPDWTIALNHDNVATMLWWKVIYSFHMPLFFCVSGYLCSINKGYLTFVKRRVQSLLLPFLTFTIIEWIISGYFDWGSGPWFLETLFFFTLIYALSSLILKFVKIDNGVVLLLTMLAGLILFRKFVLSFQSQNLNLVVDTSHLTIFNYVGFLLGVALKKYKCIYEKIKNELGFSVLLLVWLILFVLQQYHIQVPYIGYILIEISAILTIWLFFDLGQTSKRIKTLSMTPKTSLKRILELLGTYSLHIYLLHLFYRIRIIDLGSYFLSLADKNEYTLSLTLCTLQLVYSIAMTALVIFLCILTTKFVAQSKMFNFLLFGKTN